MTRGLLGRDFKSRKYGKPILLVFNGNIGCKLNYFHFIRQIEKVIIGTAMEDLTGRSLEETRSILESFLETNAETFDFNAFHTDDKWNKYWRSVFTILKEKTMDALRIVCLNVIRILSRDKDSVLGNHITEDFDFLLELAELKVEQQEKFECEGICSSSETAIEVAETDPELIVAALKCICNLVYQSAQCRQYCVKLNTVDALNRRIRSSVARRYLIEYYDLKLLFLITAFEPVARSRMQIDLNGVTYMTEWLDEKVNEYNLEQLDSISEVLKVIFNITTNADKSPVESEIQNLHLTSVLRQLLIKFGGKMENDQHRAVVTNAINLLTNISTNCLIELMTKCERVNSQFDDEKVKTVNEVTATVSACEEPTIELIFEKRNILAIDVILRYLQTVLNDYGKEATANDNISPVLTVLVKCARAHAIMRRYIRSKVLPPLRDVSQRPEVGNELRNHLCRFLTMPQNTLNELSAELLFICCKENVNRMIKYTGYGNAAGLFAKRGLMDCRRIENTDYSSDSEDSDTEEYKNVQSKVNPISGAAELPHPNPLAGMTEEQKEYEAEKLANLIDKLHRTGVIQPCRIDEEGRPQPVEHILQLQQELPQQQLEQKHKS